MTYEMVRRSAMIVAGVCSIALATPVFAQGWQYPSYTPPRVVARELSIGVSGAGDAGTTLVGQWHELIAPRTDLSLDLGIASPKGPGDNPVVLGAGFGHQIARSNANNPLDALLTAGIYGAFRSGPDLVRVPVGVSVGHRFPLEGQMAVTPYVHPRVSFDFLNGDNNVTVDFDLGGNLELTRELSLRASLLVSGGDTFTDDTGFGIMLAWRPAPLRR